MSNNQSGSRLRREITLPRYIRRALGNKTSTFILWFPTTPTKERVDEFTARLYGFIEDQSATFQAWIDEDQGSLRIAKAKLKDSILKRFGKFGSNEIINFDIVSSDEHLPKKLHRHGRSR
jgi:hypothetical protein